jgi:glycosyltransferase involved in cell wall biosynthesis
MLLHKSVQFDSRVRREASALASAGHAVCVVELADVPAGQSVLDGFRRRSCLPPEWIRRRLPFGMYRLAFLYTLIRAAVATAPDVVHAHDAAMLLPGLVAARLTGARLVYDSHELATSVVYRERAWAWFVGAIERLVVPRCAAVITVSDGIAQRIRDRYRLPVTPTVVRNVSALAVQGQGRLRRRIGIAETTALVLHQGAPAPDRGCETLLDAVMRRSEVRLVFLGDPEPGYGARLAAEITARGLGDRVFTLPSLPLSELLAATAEADVGVTLLQDTCENHRLALPNKIFEYIAARIPVIASALPETNRLVCGYGVGWTVPPADPGALATAIDGAIAARGDPALAARLRDAAGDLNWDRERLRLTGLYDWLAER